jgi:hypothetical protein
MREGSRTGRKSSESSMTVHEVLRTCTSSFMLILLAKRVFCVGHGTFELRCWASAVGFLNMRNRPIGSLIYPLHETVR